MMQALFPDDHLFSPSQLETYAACPFRFFGRHVLRLEEREVDLTRMHYGSLVHRVLQRIYAEKRQKSRTSPDGPLPPLTRQDRERLVQLFQEEESFLDEGVLSPDLGVMFVSPGGVIDLFLRILESVEAPPQNFGNLLTEYPLDKVELGKDASGRPVLLTGKIDRVDVKRSESGAALIVDYKTAGSPRAALLKTKMGDGRMLQLPLYAAALQISRPDLNVIGAAYIHLSEKAKSEEVGAKKAIVSLGQLSAKREPESDLWNTGDALELALDFAGQIRAGRFGLTRHGNGSDEPECTGWCPLRHACRHPEGYKTSNW
jgi:ATP-dependent helicase/DNAse subunit B